MKKRTRNIATKALLCIMLFVFALPASGVFAEVASKSDDFNRDISLLKADTTTSSGTTADIKSPMFASQVMIIDRAATEESFKYVVGDVGRGKGAGDSFLKMYTPYDTGKGADTGDENEIQLRYYPEQLVTEGKYLIVKAQMSVDDSNAELGMNFKNNDQWNSGIVEFNKVQGKIRLGGVEPGVAYETGKWYNFVIVMKQGETTYEIWINGEKAAERELKAPLSKLDAIVITQYSSKTENKSSCAYVDNTAVYESEIPYSGENADTSLTTSSPDFTAAGNLIKVSDLSSNTLTAGELKNALTPADGAVIRIMKSDKAIELADDEFITPDTLVFVEAADGVTLKQYSLSDGILNLHEDLYNRSIEIITKDTEHGTFYTSFGSDILNPYYLEGNKNFLIENDYIDIVSGKGKQQNDSFARVHTAVADRTQSEFIEFSTAYPFDLPLSASLDSVCEFDVYTEDTNPDLSLEMKLDNTWAGAGFRINGKSFESMKGGATKTISAGQWYKIAFVIKDGAYDVYIDGNLIKSNIAYNNLTVKPTVLSAVTCKITRINTEADIYFDNFRIYDIIGDYNPVKTTVASEIYTVGENSISGVSGGTLTDELISGLVLPKGASYAFYNADMVTPVLGETVENGMVLAVYTGYTAKLYKIDSRDYVNYNEDLFDRSISKITADTTLNGSYYPGLGGILSGVYYHEGNKSWLYGNDYVDITKAPCKNDTSLKIYADKYTENQNTNIEFYKMPNISLSSEYDFVFEFDMRSDDLNAAAELSFKFNTTDWVGGILFKDGKWNLKRDKITPLTDAEAGQWYHVAYVVRKNSNLFDVYVDGEKLVNGEQLLDTRPSTFAGISLKINKAENPSSIYIDNLKYYEYTKTYEPAENAVTSDYIIDGTDVCGIAPNTAVSDFALNLPEGASFEVYNSDEFTIADGIIKTGMKAAVKFKDGSVKLYNLLIDGEEKVTFYNGYASLDTITEAVNGTAVAAKVEGIAGRVVLAVYENNTLKGIAAADNTTTCTLKVGNLESGKTYTAKVIVMENFNSAKPLCDVYGI